MAGLKGIAGNRKFMDHYYNFCKLNKKLESDKNEDTAKTRHDSCQQYINALNVCVERIKNSHNQKDRCDYLDYIRWNYASIKNRLSDYLSSNDAPQQSLSPVIKFLNQCIDEIMQINFRFSETDKAVVNQFTHALERAKRGNCQKVSVYLHAARLYINYINLLKNKRFVECTDSEDFTFENLNSHAKYLMDKLPKYHNLVQDIQMAIESYADFRYQDTVLRALQDTNIVEALIYERQKVLCVTLMKHFR